MTATATPTKPACPACAEMTPRSAEEMRFPAYKHPYSRNGLLYTFYSIGDWKRIVEEREERLAMARKLYQQDQATIAARDSVIQQQDHDIMVQASALRDQLERIGELERDMQHKGNQLRIVRAQRDSAQQRSLAKDQLIDELRGARRRDRKTIGNLQDKVSEQAAELTKAAQVERELKAKLAGALKVAAKLDEPVFQPGDRVMGEAWWPRSAGETVTGTVSEHKAATEGGVFVRADGDGEHRLLKDATVKPAPLPVADTPWKVGDIVEYDAYGSKFRARLTGAPSSNGSHVWSGEVTEAFTRGSNVESTLDAGDTVHLVDTPDSYSTKVAESPRFFTRPFAADCYRTTAAGVVEYWSPLARKWQEPYFNRQDIFDKTGKPAPDSVEVAFAGLPEGVREHAFDK